MGNSDTIKRQFLLIQKFFPELVSDEDLLEENIERLDRQGKDPLVDHILSFQYSKDISEPLQKIADLSNSRRKGFRWIENFVEGISYGHRIYYFDFSLRGIRKIGHSKETFLETLEIMKESIPFVEINLHLVPRKISFSAADEATQSYNIVRTLGSYE
jgi:hypothetical protein